MITQIHHQRSSFTYRILSAFIAFTFAFGIVIPPQVACAQMAPVTILNLPVPGAMVPVSPGYAPTLVTGITIHPENPLEFDFMISTGDSGLRGDALKDESQKLIKYFLASLTVPEEELWVNLSPYEKDRIIPQVFGETEMGRDLLAQDYLLKQLTASLMYPEDELGKKFWDRVYKKAYEQFGTTEIPMNTFNKVWIVPDTAMVLEKDGSAYVLDSRLKVMLEEDYLALKNNMDNEKFSLNQVLEDDAEVISGVTSDVVREVLIPEIEKEVNEGETFANLRQIYNSMILATWYKQNLKQTLLGQVYVDQNKIKGVDVKDKQVKEKIYRQYLEAFQKGVYNYIKEDYDPATQEIVPRKYFSGGGYFRSLGKDLDKIVPQDLLRRQPTPEQFISFLLLVKEMSNEDYDQIVVPVFQGFSAEEQKYITNQVRMESKNYKSMQFEVNTVLLENIEDGDVDLILPKSAREIASSPVGGVKIDQQRSDIMTVIQKTGGSASIDALKTALDGHNASMTKGNLSVSFESGLFDSRTKVAFSEWQGIGRENPVFFSTVVEGIYGEGDVREGINGLYTLTDRALDDATPEQVDRAYELLSASSPVKLDHPLEDMVSDAMRNDPVIGKRTKVLEASYYQMLNLFVPYFLESRKDNLDAIRKDIDKIAEYLKRAYDVEISGEYGLDYVRKVIEAEMKYTLYMPQFRNLQDLQDRIADGKIHPNEIQLDEDYKLTIADGINEISLLFWPQKVDPLHAGHLEMAQNAALALNLSIVFYVVDKMDFRKGKLSSIYMRQPQIRGLLDADGMAPLVQYLPVMEKDEKVWGGVGEQSFFQKVLPKIVEMNKDLFEKEGMVIKIGYGAGTDHMQMYYQKIDEDGKKTDDLSRPDVSGIFYEFVQGVLDSKKGQLYNLLWNGKLKIPVFFSGRDEDRRKFSEEQLDAVKAKMMELVDRNGKPILEVDYKFQDVSVSSTRIRDYNHSWLLPFDVYSWARGFEYPRWGYTVTEAEQNEQETIAENLKQEFDKVFDQQINNNEIKERIRALLQNATGTALNTFDLYLNNQLVDHILYERSKHPENFDIKLHHLGDLAEERLSEYKSFLMEKGIDDQEEAEIAELIRSIQTELLQERGEAIVAQSLGRVPGEIIDVLGNDRVVKVVDEVKQSFASSPIGISEETGPRFYVKNITEDSSIDQINEAIDAAIVQINEDLNDGVEKYMAEKVAEDRFTPEVAKSSAEATIKSFNAWLTSAYIDKYTKLGLLQALADKRYEGIVTAHSKNIKFGTAGLREKAAQTMEELKILQRDGFRAIILKGPNMINNVTLSLASMGVIRSFKAIHKATASIAYDTRVNGANFADLIAAIFVKEGGKVHLFDKAAPMPEMSFSVADLLLGFGILISASHNAAPFNGDKVSNEMGAQLDPVTRALVMDYIYGNDQKLIEAVTFEDIADILQASIEIDTPEVAKTKTRGKYELGPLVERFAKGKEDQVVILDSSDIEADPKGRQHIDIHNRHADYSVSHVLDPQLVKTWAPRIKMIFSPFYGVGLDAFRRTAVDRLGLKEPLVVEEYTRPDGTFTRFSERTVNGKLNPIIPDPGNSAGHAFTWELVIEDLIQQIQTVEGLDRDSAIVLILKGLDLLGGTDPDADRLGVPYPIQEEDLPPELRALDALPPILTSEKTEANAARIAQLIAYVVPRHLRKEVGFAGIRLMTANDTWALKTKYRIDRFAEMIESGKVPKGLKFTIVKTHVTTDALAALATYAKNAHDMDIEVIEPYVGFTLVGEAIQKGWEQGKVNLSGDEESGGTSFGGAPTIFHTLVHLYQKYVDQGFEVTYNEQNGTITSNIDDPLFQVGNDTYFAYTVNETVEMLDFLTQEGVVLKYSTRQDSFEYRLNEEYVKTAENEENYWSKMREIQKSAPGKRLGKRGHTLEKDGLLAFIMIIEAAAKAKSLGMTFSEYIKEELYLNPDVGYFSTINIPWAFKETISGTAEKIKTLRNILGLARDFKNGEKIVIAGQEVKDVQIFLPETQKYDDPVNFPVSDFKDLISLLSEQALKDDTSLIKSFFPEEGVRFIFDDARKNHLTIRPSGTENKLRFYAQWVPSSYTRNNLTERALEADRMSFRVIVGAQNRLKEIAASSSPVEDSAWFKTEASLVSENGRYKIEVDFDGPGSVAAHIRLTDTTSPNNNVGFSVPRTPGEQNDAYALAREVRRIVDIHQFDLGFHDRAGSPSRQFNYIFYAVNERLDPESVSSPITDPRRAVLQVSDSADWGMALPSDLQIAPTGWSKEKYEELISLMNKYEGGTVKAMHMIFIAGDGGNTFRVAFANSSIADEFKKSLSVSGVNMALNYRESKGALVQVGVKPDDLHFFVKKLNEVSRSNEFKNSAIMAMFESEIASSPVSDEDQAWRNSYGDLVIGRKGFTDSRGVDHYDQDGFVDNNGVTHVGEKGYVDNQGIVHKGSYGPGRRGSSPVQKTDETVGGIDLNSELLDLQIKRDGNGIPLPLIQQTIGTMKIDGFLPVIINITPLANNLPMFLGMLNEKGDGYRLGFRSGFGPTDRNRVSAYLREEDMDHTLVV